MQWSKLGHRGTVVKARGKESERERGERDKLGASRKSSHVVLLSAQRGIEDRWSFLIISKPI